MKDLHARLDTIKLLEKNIYRTLFRITCGNIFFDLSPKVMEIKAKINKWDLIKLKNLAQQRKPSTKWKDNLQGGRKYLQMMQITRAYFIIYKSSYSSLSKKNQTNHSNKWSEDLNRHLFQCKKTANFYTFNLAFIRTPSTKLGFTRVSETLLSFYLPTI